jgi:predicted CoA-binding protein
MEKTTVLLGASPKPDRFAYKAVRSLQRRNIPVIALGRKDADLDGIKIRKGMPGNIGPVHTVTLYLNPKNQEEYYDYIISLQPSRIIFNPGTWNPDLAELARSHNIEVVRDCMLIMLNSSKF